MVMVSAFRWAAAGRMPMSRLHGTHSLIGDSPHTPVVRSGPPYNSAYPAPSSNLPTLATITKSYWMNLPRLRRDLEASFGYGRRYEASRAGLGGVGWAKAD